MTGWRLIQTLKGRMWPKETEHGWSFRLAFVIPLIRTHVTLEGVEFQFSCRAKLTNQWRKLTTLAWWPVKRAYFTGWSQTWSIDVDLNCHKVWGCLTPGFYFRPISISCIYLKFVLYLYLFEHSCNVDSVGCKSHSMQKSLKRKIHIVWQLQMVHTGFLSCCLLFLCNSGCFYF